MTEELSLTLPLAAAAGSQADLAALVDDYSTTLFRVAHSLLRNPAEAEDVVQDVFVRVIEHQHALPAVRDLRVWLVRIAWNLALDRRRRIRPQQMDDRFARSLVTPGLSAEAAHEQARSAQAALHAIDRLPARERQALLLCAVEELDTAEIARIMGKSEAAVRAILFRARTHLRQRLEKGGQA